MIRFGTFEVDFQAGELRKQGRKIKLQEKPLLLLSILLERPVVERETGGAPVHRVGEPISLRDEKTCDQREDRYGFRERHIGLWLTRFSDLAREVKRHQQIEPSDPENVGDALGEAEKLEHESDHDESRGNDERNPNKGLDVGHR